MAKSHFRKAQRTPVDYGTGGGIGGNLQRVAALIAADMPTHLYYVTYHDALHDRAGPRHENGVAEEGADLSAASGGRALMTEKPEELHSAFADLLQELSNQYLLGYSSTNTKRDGTLRRLKVEVEGHRQIRAREAYRAPGPK